MIQLTYIEIQNGNNAPILYATKANRVFNDLDELGAYKKRIRRIARKRYKRTEITVMFKFTNYER